ncbi:MAG TPA: 50S ribosomal protein L11 methyltransferase [Desulfuromonadales bacterium]|nr:50S ribosomal protein L11 methyltransferase [Desulfuromonadales bacterium]
MNDSWLEISCDVPVELADLVAAFLTELTGIGVCEDNRTVDAFAPGEIPHMTWTSIKAYLPADEDPAPKMARLEEYLSEVGAGRQLARPTIATIRTEEWSTSWKVNFKPLRIGSRLLVVPTWEEEAALPGDVVLRIDPGMAFGTGGHETTRLCLELLEQIMANNSFSTAPSLLDLGTGSGILSMAASLLGAGRVVALDIDPEAILVAQENLLLNGLAEKIETGTTPLEALNENFDIILANILAEELVRLSPALSDRLNPGGYLILSGILTDKEPLVLDGFKPHPLNHAGTSRDGEWSALTYRKPALS